MSQISINKLKKYENGVTIKLKYEGTSTPVFDEEKAYKLIETFFSSERLVSDMPRNISYIRTILKDANEKLLAIEYNDGKNVETIQYDNKNLVLFECKKYDRDSNCMEVSFTSSNGLNVSFSGLGLANSAKYAQMDNMKSKFNKVIEHIDELKYVGFVSLDNDSKLLVEVYKIFYKENPDFSKEDINIKIQAMVSILSQFDIYCGDYSFSFDGNMPESIALYAKVYDLFPLGEITVVDDPVELKTSAKERIEIVGETVRNAFSNEENINETLITISKTIYAGRYDVSHCDVRELIKNSNINLTVSEAESSLKLVKKINDRMTENMLNKSHK